MNVSRVSQATNPQPSIVRLEGEWDLARQPELHSRLLPMHDVEHVVLDFTGSDYVDSSLLTVLVGLRKRRRENGLPPVRLAIPSTNVRRLFSITKLDTVWPIFASLDEAVQSFETAPEPI